MPCATPAAPAAVPCATDERLDQPAPAGVAGKPEKPWNRGVPVVSASRSCFDDISRTTGLLVRRL